MNYNLIDEIQNVRAYLTTETDIFFTRGNNVRNLSFFRNNEKVLEDQVISSFKKIENSIYIYSAKSTLVYDFVNIKKLNYDGYILLAKHDGSFLARQKNNDLNSLVSVDKNDLSIGWSIQEESNRLHYYKDYLIVLKLTDFICKSISCLSVKSGTEIWNYSFSNGDEIEFKLLIGIYQNQVLLACSNNILISLDTETGEVLNRWHDLPGFNGGTGYQELLPDPTNFVLDQSQAKLIGVFDTYYFEINLENKEIQYFQLKEELNKHEVSDFRPFFNNPFTEDHLFLTAHSYSDKEPNVDLSSVLALNRNTKKVDWIHTFINTGLGTNIPQITDTHLYQLDLEGTLHVFEKTGDSV